MTAVWVAFLSALRFLTVLPVPWLPVHGTGATGRSVVFFPLVGLLLGLAMAGLDWLLALIFPPPVTAGLLLVWLALATGGLHLDGLADSFDGLASRGGVDEKRMVMRDSRVGAMGVVAIVSVLLVKYGAIAILPPESRFGVLVAAPLLGRWAMVYAIVRYPHSRVDGLGHAFKIGTSKGSLVVASAITVVVSLLTGVKGAFLLLGAAVTVLLWAGYLNRQFKGLTGDNYGAVNEIVEGVVLVLGILLSGIESPELL